MKTKASQHAHRGSDFLLHTSHPGIKAITIGKPDPFSYDSRVLAWYGTTNVEMRNPTR